MYGKVHDERAGLKRLEDLLTTCFIPDEQVPDIPPVSYNRLHRRCATPRFDTGNDDVVENGHDPALSERQCENGST